eukprot:17734_1
MMALDTGMVQQFTTCCALSRLTHCLLLGGDVGQGALAAGLAVLVLGHEDAGTTVGVGALHAGVGHLDVVAVTLDLVELEDTHGDVGVTVDGLLGLLEVLLLLLLALTTGEAHHQGDGGLLLDAVLGQGGALLELLASEDDAGISAVELLLDGGDGVGGLDVQDDGLVAEGLSEQLHVVSIKYRNCNF